MFGKLVVAAALVSALCTGQAAAANPPPEVCGQMVLALRDSVAAFRRTAARLEETEYDSIIEASEGKMRAALVRAHQTSRVLVLALRAHANAEEAVAREAARCAKVRG